MEYLRLNISGARYELIIGYCKDGNKLSGSIMY